jgi:hypothetical protein
MDLCVVKEASRRVRRGAFRAVIDASRPDQGRFGLSGECRPKERYDNGTAGRTPSGHPIVLQLLSRLAPSQSSRSHAMGELPASAGCSPAGC